MARPWYAFYPADYGRDTGHLSLVEHGAYRALMDHYYATAAPLPPDEARLLHLCRARLKGEKDAVRFVLGKFFIAESDGWHHRRIDAELERAAELSAKCRFAARIRHGAKPADAYATGHAEALPSQSQPQSQEIESGFEDFWKAYPRREAKGAALKAWGRAVTKAQPLVIVAAAAGYAARRAGQDANFTRTPANWLAQECWLDDVAVPQAPVDDAAAAAAWEGCAAPLVAQIGGAAFQAYFADAVFAPPAAITVATPFLRDLVARKFSAALRRAFGDFTLEVCP